MNKLFNYLVITVIALYAAFIALPFYWHHLYEGETLIAMQWNGWGSLIEPNGIIAWSFAMLNFIALIGLIYFKKWARTLFLVITISTGLISPAFGLIVAAGIDAIVGYYISISYGIIVTMSYFTSVSNEFKT